MIVGKRILKPAPLIFQPLRFSLIVFSSQRKICIKNDSLF